MASTSARPSAPADFHFRRLSKPEEFRQVEEVQRRVWSGEGAPVAPALQRAVQDNGGIILGAFADIHLAGFTFGFLGWDGERLYHYSHLTAVRPEYQNHGLGRRLKLAQREEVIAQGLEEVRWTFDPLQSRNALLNVRRLGATPHRYLVHYYGQMADAINAGHESDRLLVRWRLTDPDVVRRLQSGPPSAADDAARYSRSSRIVESELGDAGLRVPVGVSEPTGSSATLEIPYDIGSVREHQPDSVRTWRHAVRDAFRAAFDLGWAVDDFAVVSIEHERRSVYFLSPGPGTTADPPSRSDAPPPA